MRVSHVLLPAVCAAFTATLTIPAQAYDQRDAIRDCERHLMRSYHYRPNQVHDVAIRRQGGGGFEIHGRINLENLSDPTFTCVVHHREVVSLRVDNARAAAESIGKGILGAVLGGIASSLERASESGDRGQPHPAYSGNGSPFHDEAFLQNACRHELRRHLRIGHGPVDNIRLTNAHLHNRTLDGDGVVRWQSGERQRIHFSCEFDRYGRIYDGRYSYYGSVADNGGGFAGGHGGGRPSQLPGGGNEMMQRVGADCVRAVRRQVGGGSPSVIDVRHGENFMTVRVSVEGAQAPWICEHSSREVMRVYYGAEG